MALDMRLCEVKLCAEDIAALVVARQLADIRGHQEIKVELENLLRRVEFAYRYSIVERGV